MTLEADESAALTGRPIELYEFVLVGVTTFRYTDYHEDLVELGQTWQSIPIERGSLEGSGQEDSATMEVTVSYTQDILTDLLYTTPPQRTTIKIQRYHEGNIADIETIWDGVVSEVERTDDTAAIRSESSLGERLRSPVPTVAWQALCNHILYDDRCALDIDAAANTHNTTIASVTDLKTFTVSSLHGGAPDQTYTGGEVVRTSDGERRLVINQVGTAFKVLTPFRDLVATDSVKIIRGCDHSVATCNTKFTNLVNFGGHPNIQQRDLFQYGLKNNK